MQLPAAAALLLLLAVADGLQGAVLELLPYPHGLVKGLLQAWHVLLLRAPLLPWLLGGALALGLVLAALPPRIGRWVGGVAALGALAVPGSSWETRGVLALLLAANLAAGALWQHRAGLLRGISWLPGALLLLPTPLIAELSGARRWPLALALPLLVPLWFLADIALMRERYLPQLIEWPDQRVDPRVRALERAAAMRGEYHDIEALGDHVAVVAEDSCRLLAVPLGGGPVVEQLLAPRWPPFQAGALDAWVDPDGVTWLLTGPNELGGLTLRDGAWEQVATRRFPGPCNFAYLVPAPELDRLLMVFVNAHDREPGGIVPFALPGLRPLERLKLERADGSWFPTPRDAAWLPPIGRLVLTPNFGERLFLADPETGLVERWLEIYSANAKPLWSEGLGRLLLARPDAASVAVIDPVTGTVERSIPTQRGVRALAVDAERGLLVTGSVLSGRVEVRRLEDGALVDSFGTLMPMIREITLVPERGEAIVATWTVLYSLPYASSGS